MIYCTNCKTELKTETNYCKNCGVALKPTEVEDIEIDEQKNGLPTWAYILIAIGISALILIVFFGVINNSRSSMEYSRSSNSNNRAVIQGIPVSGQATKENINRAIPSLNKDRQLIKQFLQMYGEYNLQYDEDDLDEFMSELTAKNLHPVEIYMGSLIFYGESWGYIYDPDLDNDFRRLPEISVNEIKNLVSKYGGTTPAIFQDDRVISFQDVNSMKRFLSELWSL